MKGAGSNKRRVSIGSRLSMKTRRAISGYMFIMPFIVGFLAFMVAPLFMSLRMTFSQVNASTIEPSDFRMISNFGYDKNVRISKEIELPEYLRYNELQYKEGIFEVEYVDDVLTLRSDFAYGPVVELAREIALPNTVWYNPADLAQGKYTVEPLKTAFELGADFYLGSFVTLDEEVALPSGLQYSEFHRANGSLVVEQINTQLELKAGESLGSSVTLTKEIDLPEGYWYNPVDMANKVYRVQPLTVAAEMALPQELGTAITLPEKISLPKTVQYNPLQEENGVYVVESAESLIELQADSTFGAALTLSRQIELPEGYAYDEAQLAEGAYVVKMADDSEIPASFAAYLFDNGHSDLLTAAYAAVKETEAPVLPEGSTYDKALFEAKGDFVIKPSIPASFATYLINKSEYSAFAAVMAAAQGLSDSAELGLPEHFVFGKARLEDEGVVEIQTGTEDGVIPVSFAKYLFDEGETDQLATVYAAAKGTSKPSLPKTCGYDKVQYEATGDFIVKLTVPTSFAKYLMDNQHYALFAQAVAAARGMTMEEQGLPEIFTYDKAMFDSKKIMAVQVHDEEANVPNSFAVYLVTSGNADLFYDTVNPLVNSETVCHLYDPVKDASGKLTSIGELPENIVVDQTTFSNTGVIIVKLDSPIVPSAFASYIMDQGGFGMFLGTLVDFLGLENYHNALAVDRNFNQLLVDEISKMAIHTVAILVVAFVIAILLNQEFKGRALVRAIFFLPVILSSGVLVNLETNNTLMQGMQEMISEETPFTVTDSMMEILTLTGLGGDILDVIFELIAEVYDIVMASGIQIIVFLSGLQNVPASLYEAADVEGCTKWEAFWMITFPMVSPLLIVNIIYTIIDFFTKMGSDLSDKLDQMLIDLQYDWMSAMSWIYFLVTLALIGVSAFFVSKVVATDE